MIKAVVRQLHSIFALYVEEKNRSWCSRNKANDHRAITIEVANTIAADPWPVWDKAYAALIDLLVDICQRKEAQDWPRLNRKLMEVI